MKSLFIGLLLVSGLAQANNPWAPTLETVGVLYDVADREYSPFLFNLSLDIHTSMNMDPSCEKIMVNHRNQVSCISSKGEINVAGIIGEKRNQDGFWQFRSVIWDLNRVKLQSKQTPRGTIYFITIK